MSIGRLESWEKIFRDGDERYGLWVARDAAFFERSVISFFGQLRILPDFVIIVVGVLPLVWFLLRTFPHLKAQEITGNESVWDRLGVKL